MVEEKAEADSGPHDRHAGPERLCVATRTVRPIDDMIRFVLGPDGRVVPDVKRKLPGRGVWVGATRAAVETAVARRAFARGFKRPAEARAGLAAETERLLELAVLDALGIVIKAGGVAAGFTKAEAALRAGAAVALLQAAEAAPDGVRKLAAAARGAGADRPPVIIFDGSQLDLALGRSNVVHAALLAGPASEALLARYRCLEYFRGGEPARLASECG